MLVLVLVLESTAGEKRGGGLVGSRIDQDQGITCEAHRMAIIKEGIKRSTQGECFALRMRRAKQKGQRVSKATFERSLVRYVRLGDWRWFGKSTSVATGQSERARTRRQELK